MFVIQPGRLLPVIFALLLLSSCGPSSGTSVVKPAATGQGVELVAEDGGYQLYVQGQPFQVKGASGYEFWEELAARGGNTVRTYSDYRLDSLLELAAELDLMVAVGLEIPTMRSGFRPDDEKRTQALQKRILATVNTFKGHPNVLCWVLGNEVNLMHFPDKSYWTWTNDLIDQVHAADPGHPVMVCVNEMRKNYELSAELAPSLDILGINVFKNGERMLFDLGAEDTWNRAIMLAEWAPEGYWEAAQTEWGAPIEKSDLEKSAIIPWYYDTYIDNGNPNLLGSMAFYWGQKQERTHTWFSLFSEQGEITPMIDALERIWTDTVSGNHAPQAQAIRFEGFEDQENVYLAPGDTVLLKVYPEDPDGDELAISWELLPEGDYMLTTGGDEEARPEPLDVELKTYDNMVWFAVPEKSGPYRIFAYVRDGKGGFGSHNLPFFVKAGK